MTGPRDWDREMAEIDRMIAAEKQGAAPPALPAGAAPAQRAAPAAGPPARERTPVSRPRDAVGVWLRAVLGALGAAALVIWPYGTACGTPLYGYLAGAGAVAALGLITMRAAWVHRRGVAHTAGLLVFLAGLALAAREILPRTGYAAVAKTWTCT